MNRDGALGMDDVAAFVLALVYGWLCRLPVDESREGRP
jgi:hypothetical protein